MEDHIENQKQVLQTLKDNLNLAQNQMKQHAYQHRSKKSFYVGKWLFLWLQSYKQMPLKQAKKDNKLSSNNIHNGSCGYLWLNGGITLPSIL